MPSLVPVILALFVLAAILRVDFYFNVVYLMAGMYVLSRLWTRQAQRQVRAHRHFINRAFPGEEVVVTLRVENTGWLPIPWVEVYDSQPAGMAATANRNVLTLGTKAVQQVQHTLTCYKRGYYMVGPTRLHTGDLFGLVPPRVVDIPPEPLIIYPRVVALESLGLPTRSPLVALPAPAPLFEDPARIMGVRPYQPGDSPRRIHWTASASAGQLLVKRYQPAIARETLLCLALERADYDPRRVYDAVELAIVVAASIANHIIVREGLAVGLTTQARDPLLGQSLAISLPPHNQRGHLMGILEVLARVQPVQRTASDTLKPFPDFLREVSMSLAWGATVVVITGQADTALMHGMAYLRQAGFAVALLLVMPPTTDNKTQARAESLRIPVHRLWREEDLRMAKGE